MRLSSLQEVRSSIFNSRCTSSSSAPWAESLGKFRFYMQRFESRRPSQPVRLQRDTYEDRSKTARHREVSQICLGLRVRNSAMEASCRPPVSEDHFWCLVFTERPLPHIHDPDRFLLNWRRGAETAPPGSGSNSRVARFASATEPPSVARYREVLLCGATSGCSAGPAHLVRLLHHHTPLVVIDNPRALSHLNPGLRPAPQGDLVKLCGQQVVFRSAEMFQ